MSKHKIEKASATPEKKVKTTLHRRTMTGTVVSDKMMKTRVIQTERHVLEKKYGKYITKASRFKIHDENNTSKMGDLVSIVESRPLSKDKRWALQKVVRRAAANVLNKA